MSISKIPAGIKFVGLVRNYSKLRLKLISQNKSDSPM